MFRRVLEAHARARIGALPGAWGAHVSLSAWSENRPRSLRTRDHGPGEEGLEETHRRRFVRADGVGVPVARRCRRWREGSDWRPCSWGG